MRLRNLLAPLPLALLVTLAPPAAAEDEDKDEETTPATGVVASARAVELLTERLATSDSFKVRAQAAVLLGRVGDQRAVPVLLRALREDDHFVVRSAAATALGTLGDDAALEPLFDGTSSDEPLVRDACARALTRLDARRNFDALARYAKEGLPEQRRVAIARLGDLARTGDASAVEILVAALGDEQSVREASARAFADLPTDRAVPILMGALSHEKPAVRAEAARLLGARRDVRSLEALATAYERVGEEERVKAEIRRSLERLRPLVDISDVISQARSAPDAQLRVRAIRLLSVVGDPRAASAMEDLLKDEDPFIQGTAALALADLGSVQSIARLEEAATRAKATRAEAPISAALKKLRRLQGQSR